MIGRPQADSVGLLLHALGRTGRSGRELGVRLDLLRSLGFGPAWRRARAEATPAPEQDSGGADPAHAAIWRDAAQELGAEVVDRSCGYLEIRRGDADTLVWNHWTTLDDAVTVRFALDKLLVHRALQSARLPVPDHAVFDFADLSPAVAFLAGGSQPCVVKPVNSSGGSGVTSGIRSHQDLRRAALRAGRLDGQLLIERRVSGQAYRLLYLDGELLDAVRRLPPAVTGDGRSSIEQLVAAENRRRALEHPTRRLSPLRVDLECILTLDQMRLTLASVPPSGSRIQLKSVVSQNGPHENESVRKAVSDELAAEGAAAAAAVGLRLAGVDVMTTDPSTGLRAAGGAILEVNGPPGLHYHYAVREPDRATRVAVPILRKLLG
jgi:D-alanine-D-alanine ligase-like ATP-grasp enzyme